MAKKKSLNSLEQLASLEKEEKAIAARREAIINKRYIEIGKIVKKAGLFHEDNSRLVEILNAGKEMVEEV